MTDLELALILAGLDYEVLEETGEAPGVAVAEADQPVPSPEEAEQLLRSWPRWAGLPPRLRQA